MRFVMELPDEYATIVDEIRANDPLKPVSRRQIYTKIVMEWLEANGYLQGDGNKDKESEKERKRRELQEEYRRKLAELEV